MPTYVYACQACSQVVERRQSFTDAPLTDCELCGGALRRVLQPVGIIFKGSGFYSTDHRNGSATANDGASAPAGTALANEPSADSGSKSTDKKVNAKPAPQRAEPAKSTAKETAPKAVSEAGVKSG